MMGGILGSIGLRVGFIAGIMLARLPNIVEPFKNE